MFKHHIDENFRDSSEQVHAGGSRELCSYIHSLYYDVKVASRGLPGFAVDGVVDRNRVYLRAEPFLGIPTVRKPQIQGTIPQVFIFKLSFPHFEHIDPCLHRGKPALRRVQCATGPHPVNCCHKFSRREILDDAQCRRPDDKRPMTVRTHPELSNPGIGYLSKNAWTSSE